MTSNSSDEKEVEKQSFLKRKNIEISVQRYLIDTLSFMALGLFASLLIGTILNTIGGQLNIPFLVDVIWPLARDLTGPAIGVAIAYGLKAPPLVLFASTITGGGGAALGGPVGAMIATIVGVELGKMVSKETKIDLLVTPAVTIVSGVLVGTLIGPGINAFMVGIGKVIMNATNLQPFLMGIIVSVIVGMILTLPISSAAICLMLSLGGLAAGASTVGCCAQMVGFAVMSYRDNGIGGSLSIGIGTSMLQVPNIVRNWKIWIPPTLTAAIMGPIATVVFKMENIAIGAGMGTSGLVGQFTTYATMDNLGRSGMPMLLTIVGLHFIGPMILTLIIYEFMRKKDWIKDGDLRLDL